MNTFTLPADVMQALADEYQGQPNSSSANHIFAALLKHAQRMVAESTTSSGQLVLRDRLVDVEYGDHNPYHVFHELREDALVNGHVMVDAQYDYGHFAWSSHDMADYMAWHDVLGHVETGFDFTPDGELSLFAYHANELLDHGELGAVAALFTEIVYRVSHINVYGWTWQYRPVMPGPLAFHVMNQVLDGQSPTMPEHFHKQPFMVAA